MPRNPLLPLECWNALYLFDLKRYFLIEPAKRRRADRQEKRLLKSLNFSTGPTKPQFRHLSPPMMRRGHHLYTYIVGLDAPKKAVSLIISLPLRRPATCKMRYFRLYYRRYQEAILGTSQKRAIQSYRTRLSERGLARFEVLGRVTDRDLIRSLARRLAAGGPDASRLRTAVRQSIAGEPPKKGGILAALRRSPLVDAGLGLTRPREQGRKVEL